MVDACGGATNLLHVAGTAPPSTTTSPRRVSIPVLVRDGKPCNLVVASQQNTPSISGLYPVSLTTGFGATSSGMPSAGAYYPSQGAGCPTNITAVTASRQTVSVNGLTSATPGSISLPVPPTTVAVVSSLNRVVASNPRTAVCYGQPRWWWPATNCTGIYFLLPA